REDLGRVVGRVDEKKVTRFHNSVFEARFGLRRRRPTHGVAKSPSLPPYSCYFYFVQPSPKGPRTAIMTARNDSVPPKRDDGDFEEIYLKHFDFLLAIASRKFGVPASEAETLVHEVFLSYLKRSGEIHDIHAWLLGGICHASR